MTFLKQPLPKCPACGDRALLVIECRRTKASIRRRKECRSCGHRLTSHEVSQDWFDAANENARVLSAVQSALTTAQPQAVDPCRDCSLNTGSSCSLKLPEYGCADAEGCPAYSLAAA